jgi:CRP/FNR family transcriptional regulator, cyclic AMP receptor protein
MEHIETDALRYLPPSTVMEYRRGEEIYTQGAPATHLYAVVQGSVKVGRVARGGRPMVIDLYMKDRLFGEWALTSRHRREHATAMEAAAIMVWPIAQVQSLMAERPKFAVALLNVIAQRSSGFLERVEYSVTASIPQRVAAALLHFAGQAGVEGPEGWIRTGPLTHEFIAEYVGASREVVTTYLTEFRRKGHVLYSRRQMLVHRAALMDIVAGDSSGAPQPRAGPEFLALADRAASAVFQASAESVSGPEGTD